MGQKCENSLAAHVYRPARLQPTGKGCITVAGIIVYRKPEKDGDIHIRVLLARGQAADLINTKNRTAQHGALVIEPMCQKPPTQRDAVEVCKGWKQNVIIPTVGDHVQVTGIHVLDKQHGWLELHPVTSIRVIP